MKRLLLALAHCPSGWHIRSAAGSVVGAVLHTAPLPVAISSVAASATRPSSSSDPRGMPEWGA